MTSNSDECSLDAEGLGKSDHLKSRPSSDEIVTTTCESTNQELRTTSDKNCISDRIETSNSIGCETKTGGDIPSLDNTMQTDSDEIGEKLNGNVSDEGEQSEQMMIIKEVHTVDPTNQEDKLLSEISELVEQQDVEIGTGDAHNELDGENLGTVDEGQTEMETDADRPKCAGGDDMNNLKTNERGSPILQNEDGNTNLNSRSTDSPKELGMGTSEVKKPKVSAVDKLTSLGLIPEEKPVVEDKETILKKLASRGGISIMPAGSTPSSVSSPVSIKPTLVKPVPVSIKPPPAKPGSSKPSSASPAMAKSTVSSSSLSVAGGPLPVTPTKSPYKPGPKSAKKKIKIDPGKSLDIEKDFNSLINFLSAGTDVSSTSGTNTPNVLEEKVLSDETVSENVNDPKPETHLDISEVSNQSTNDGHASGMDVDANDDKSESESHDGSKLEHSSENDEKPSTINKNKNVIEEGSAEILLSANKNVFYNKVQEFNRDMSIAALTVFSEMHQQDPRTRNRGKKRKAGDANETDSNNSDKVEENVFEAGKKSENGITILEALSATGLRSIRYAREIPGVKEVIANDLSEDAVDTIKKNVDHNGVSDMVTTSMSDASLLMYQRQAGQEWYDAVDLDPYGCPARFLDAAVQAVRDGGLLLVTCTDMAILAGNAPETCHAKYGAVSLRMPACHEMALRIAMQCIESHANRYGRYIVPLLSFSADFYIRLIVQVYTSPVTCKRTTSKLAMVYQCVGCGTHSFHPLGNLTQEGHNSQAKFSLAQGPPVGTNCFHCHHKHHVGGPIWTAPLYSPKFVESMLRVAENGKFGTAKRMQGMLEVIREELLDVPLYYTIAGLCTKLHCQAIPLIDIRSAILNAGYRVSSSHAAPTAVKTNAPAKIIWDIMRCWVHMNPVSQKRLVAGSVSAAIILEPPNLIANFDIHPRARPSSATRRLVRYQQNPEKNWGPGTRARCNNTEETKDDKRRLNQNKNKNKKHIDIIEVVTIDDEDEMTEESKTAETPSTPTPDTENE